MARTIGGTDGMHRIPRKDPFDIEMKAKSVPLKTSRSSACHATAAGNAATHRANDPSWGGKSNKYK